MRVRITKLRQQGVRCPDSRDQARLEGHLVLSAADGDSHMRKLTLHGPKHGAFDGPPLTALYEPQLIHISASTIVLRGFERGEGRPGLRAGYAQEWMVEFRWHTHIGPPLGEVKPSVQTPPGPQT